MIDDMLQKDIIQPSSSPWASPIILVPKKDGSLQFLHRLPDAKFCHTERRLPLTESGRYLGSIKWIEVVFHFGSHMRLLAGRNRRKRSAQNGILPREGLFEFKIMPFGLRNALAVFQRLMDLVLSGIQWERCLVYIDDIVIMGKTFERHLQNLILVLERLRRAGLRLKPSKCSLFQEKVVYLGHVVMREGIHTDPEKVNAVKTWLVPTSGRDVQQFLGLVG